MAVSRNRKNNPPPPPKKQGPFVFWTLFFIVVFSLFFANWERIQSTVKETGLLEGLAKKSETVAAIPSASNPDSPPDIPSGLGAAAAPAQPEDADPASPEGPLSDVPSESPVAPETQPAAKPASAGASRERSLYFIRVDGDGAILRTPVTRTIATSGSPLADALRILLQGPTAEEKRRGLITLIPSGTEFLSAEVRGPTAYISFSEEFQFNTYGVEGYVGQLRQIIWTATEFPNIMNVQILIEGRVVDFLGERIKIGSPLGRDSF